jgi:hypothetical protein
MPWRVMPALSKGLSRKVARKRTAANVIQRPPAKNVGKPTI